MTLQHHFWLYLRQPLPHTIAYQVDDYAIWEQGLIYSNTVSDVLDEDGRKIGVIMPSIAIPLANVAAIVEVKDLPGGLR